ncbi:uncharacterized protein [Aegilops tauschii subsp. strangulata]|uniref:uncharacterized protein n=1 Tax=Aegilops tauschii subsp. strangulata TaxID=200361 RepID=UPI003CC88482
MEQIRLEWLRWKMNMTCMLVKNCEGQSGGLALFWKKGVNLRVVGFMSKYHIDAEITEDDGFKWRFTGIYGEPKMEKKVKTWRLLRNLKNQNDKSWLCAGDFNEVLHVWEKEGGAPRNQGYLDRFKDALECCELGNLGYVGDTFTWRNNSHTAENYIKERLDRALNRLEEQLETYWKQRAHVNWMKRGDRNTKFFHAAASERRRRNRIRKLRKEDGTIVDKEDDMKAVVTNYFLNLFTSHAGVRQDELLACIDTRVTPNMNELLQKEYTREEVFEALQSIGDLKAPGPDGMPSIFYKKCWNVVGDNIVAEVLNVLKGGPMPEGWNETCVVLIPKVKNPDSMKDLRPISLCNVVYKLISKVLANRLKQILPDIISPNQSAFVPGRLITDNILLAYECTHFIKKKRGGKEGYAAVKLDMSKAYDRVEWHFLEKMMRRMGFNEQWINRIMLCVTSVSYKVKVNDDCTEVIVPQRGLRQGDPLSPYLFLICAEGFSSLLNKAEVEGSLAGIRICNAAPRFNHLLFADDSLVLMKATRESVVALQHVLQLYEVCSGQIVNYEKSSVMFSKNTRHSQKKEVLDTLKIRAEARTERYLGLLVYVGQARKKIFEYLKDRIWQKIQGWQERLLSKMGKDVLIKACAQAIPTFAMSCFDLTKSLCEEIEHIESVSVMTRPKKDGGMGFRDIYGFNLAMLARQAWRMLSTPDSLCARVLKARYFPNTSILDAIPHPGISYTWRSILKGVALLKEGLICRVGDGTSIKIWSDPWLNREGLRTPKTPRGRCLLTRVCELVDPDTHQWDESLVRDIFIEDEAKIILATPVREDYDDFYAWFYDSKGQFSVKSAYKLYVNARDQGQPESSNIPQNNWEWKEIWNLPCQPKIQYFSWRLAHNSLPLKLNMKRRGIDCDTICVCCKRLDEDGAHLFFRCKKVKQVWRSLQPEELREEMCVCRNATEVIHVILRLPETSVQQWRRPEGECLKINCDGAFSAATGTGGWGFAVRDQAGDVRGSGAGRLQNIASAVQAEAEACAEVLNAASSWGMTNVQVELDCQVLVKALQGRDADLAAEGLLFKEIRDFARLNFSRVSFSFVPRACNSLAHALAAYGACQAVDRGLRTFQMM